MKIRNHQRGPAKSAPAKIAEPDLSQCQAITGRGERCRLGPGPLCQLHQRLAARNRGSK